MECVCESKKMAYYYFKETPAGYKMQSLTGVEHCVEGFVTMCQLWDPQEH